MGTQKGNSKPKINPNARLGTIEPKNDDHAEYRCSCCGKTYKRQQSNFNASRSPLYNGNNGYLTICRNCIDKLFLHYKEFYSGDEAQAMERLCQIFDMYFDESTWAASRNVNAANSKVSEYIKKLNVTRSSNKTQEYSNSTYSDTLLRRAAQDVKNATSFEVEKQSEADEKREEMMRFWGLGWEEKDYNNLNNMYAEWISECGEPADKTTKELYKALCYMQMQMQSVTKSGEGSLSTLIKQFKDTLEDAGLKQTGKGDGEVKLDPLGVWVEQIETYSPADFYKDKTLYSDSDGIGGYIERFMLRPLRNTFFGTNEKDSSFSLSSDDSEE